MSWLDRNKEFLAVIGTAGALAGLVINLHNDTKSSLRDFRQEVAEDRRAFQEEAAKDRRAFQVALDTAIRDYNDKILALTERQVRTEALLANGRTDKQPAPQ